jgi:hypothetical protein
VRTDVVFSASASTIARATRAQLPLDLGLPTTDVISNSLSWLGVISGNRSAPAQRPVDVSMAARCSR